MRRRVAATCIVLACGLSLVACLPNLPGLVVPTSLPPIPSVDLTPAVAHTSSPAALPTASPAPTHLGSTLAFTAIPTFTPKASQEIATTAIGTLATIEPTATATVPESISLDRLPPGTLYKRIHIENRSRKQMDISLHCTTLRGLQTVLEYANVKNLSVEAPDGNYIFVVYAGGRQMIGSFSLLTVPSLTITVYADRVAVH